MKNKRNEALSFLMINKFAVLSTSSSSQPHAAAMYYHIDNEFNFYFLMKNSTLKYHNIEDNSKAAVTVYDVQTFKEVQARGTCKTLPREDLSKHLDYFLDKMKELNQDWTPPALKMAGEEIVVVKMTPHWLRFADFKVYKEEQGTEGFDIIIGDSIN